MRRAVGLAAAVAMGLSRLTSCMVTSLVVLRLLLAPAISPLHPRDFDLAQAAHGMDEP
jgi:hypothetical protein